MFRLSCSTAALGAVARALLAFAGLAVAPAAAQSPRPNVVLIVTDDAGYADFGFQNQFTGEITKFNTPRLDQLAQQSVVFSNGYATGSLCSLSRSGFLTGRYPQKFGTESNYADTNNAIDGLPPDQVLISERFKQLGYSTAAVGKFHLGLTEAHLPASNGFDEFYGFLQGGREYFEVANQPPILRQNTPIDWATEASFNNIPNDPIYGRLLTDAFGDEASQFIANHAQAADPFLLYVPFNAPHYPNSKAKTSDANQFLDSGMGIDQRSIASLAYGMDRNVGEILDRLNDPNRDGDTTDSIRDNTIVVFINDNGGDRPLPGNRVTYDNGPLYGYKGSVNEGGIRVPFMISAPGVAPGVVNEMVSSLDLFPTLVAAAGGEQTTPTDGVDLRPLMSSPQSGPVHEALFWRMEVDGFAVREGDWKLSKGTSNSQVQLFHLNPDGSGEVDPNDPNAMLDLSAQYPEKVLELTRDYVHWEATTDKLRNTGFAPVPFNLNQFDEFKQRNELTTAFNWQWGQGWRNANDPGVTGTLQRWDAAPNTVLVFETRNDANFTSVNNIVRAAGHSTAVAAPTPEGLYEFMLNEVRLQGDFAGAADRSGTLSGNPLMFVKNLAGRHAQLSLNANKSTDPQNFTFNVNMDVILVDDLLATGDGTGAFTIGGVIRDFDAPRSLIKEGTSKLRLAGHNTFKGETRVRGGELSLETAAAALDGSQHVVVEAGGLLTLANGSIATDQLSIDPGGAFAFTGGTLQAASVVGELTNAGGAFDPNAAQGLVVIDGSYAQTAGSLHIDMGLTEPGVLVNDQLYAKGSVQLAGSLDVALASPWDFALGDAFPIVTTVGGLTGQFASVSAPTLPEGLQWAMHYTLDSATLKVTDIPGSGGPLDFFSHWRQSFGDDAGGDWDGDGDSDGEDFLAWQRGGVYESVGALTGVPEPSGLVLFTGVLLNFVLRIRKKHVRSPN